MLHRRESLQCPTAKHPLQCLTAKYPCSAEPPSILAVPSRRVSLQCQPQSIPAVPNHQVSLQCPTAEYPCSARTRGEDPWDPRNFCRTRVDPRHTKGPRGLLMGSQRPARTRATQVYIALDPQRARAGHPHRYFFAGLAAPLALHETCRRGFQVRFLRGQFWSRKSFKNRARRKGPP